MVTCRKIMAQAVAGATELAVVLFSLQTALLLCWNIILVFQKIMNQNPEQIFSIQNDLLNDDFMVLLSVTCFLSEAIVGLATAHQLHRWNKNSMRIRNKQQKKLSVAPSAPTYPYAKLPEESHPLLLFPADVQPPTIPPPEFFVAIPSIQMPMEMAVVPEPIVKTKGIRVSELTWMVIWITAIVITATACKVIPVTLGAAAIFAFLVNLLIGETDVGVRKKKNKKSLELPEYVQKEKLYWRSDPVTECVLWMQALLSFCKFMHHAVLVGILFLAVPLDNTFFVIVAFLIGVSFVVFRQYMFYIFREKCKHYYQAIVKRK